jgi:chorismate mutase
MDMRESIPAELANLRADIDRLDSALIHLLAERFDITHHVGVYKARHGLPAFAPGRERKQLERIRETAVETGLDPDFAEKILSTIMLEVVARHRHIMGGAVPATAAGKRSDTQ